MNYYIVEATLTFIKEGIVQKTTGYVKLPGAYDEKSEAVEYAKKLDIDFSDSDITVKHNKDRMAKVGNKKYNQYLSMDRFIHNSFNNV